MTLNRGVTRNLLRGTKEGAGDGSAPEGSRGRAPVWGSGDEAPSRRHMLISSYPVIDLPKKQWGSPPMAFTEGAKVEEPQPPRGWGWGGIPLPSQLGSLEKRCELT